MAFSTVFVQLVIVSAVSALTCYESDDKGNVFERSDPTWKYCSLIPDVKGGRSRVSGIGAAVENLAGYDATFGQNSKMYKVLTMCIYEKYDFGVINPALGPEPEFMFRCFCNYDRCNQAVNFGMWLNQVRTQNA